MKYYRSILCDPKDTLTAARHCRALYPGHPKGCPNWNHKDGCPPNAPLLRDTLDLSKSIFLVWNEFDIGAHARRMKGLHPKWSDRQAYCCLYWQGTARKQLREKIRLFLADHRGLKVVGCPEAQGFNVNGAMAGIGITLEWPPRGAAYQVVVAGTRKLGVPLDDLPLFGASSE